DCISEDAYITVPKIALKVGKSEITIHRHLAALSSAGMIERVGSRKTGYWKIMR
ncbi:MAG: winged helix-turn-helix transcriptional regulator, partial [Lachnospiraceae bacterium]|nr:winged helix-turn-helix transcriptional regulator [Lachnospiraceae bacterium]